MDSNSDPEDFSCNFQRPVNYDSINGLCFYGEKGKVFLQCHIEEIRKNQRLINKKSVLRETVIITAIKLQAFPEIVELLQMGANLNICDSNGNFPIHLISNNFDMTQHSNYKLFNQIINYPNIDLNAKNADKQTALHILTSQKCIEALVKRNCALNIRDNNGRTPVCCFLDHILCIQSYIKRGVRALHEIGYSKRTALDSIKQYKLIVKLLIENGAQVDDEAIHKSVDLKDEEIVEFLLQHYCEFNIGVNDALLWCFNDNKTTQSMKNLLWKYVDPVYCLNSLDDNYLSLKTIYEKWDDIYDKQDKNNFDMFVNNLFKYASHNFDKSNPILDYFFQNYTKFDLKALLTKFSQITKSELILSTFFYQENRDIDRSQSKFEQIITIYLNHNFQLTYSDLNFLFWEFDDSKLLRKLIRSLQFKKDRKFDSMFLSCLFNFSLTPKYLKFVLNNISKTYNTSDFLLLSKYVTWPRSSLNKFLYKFANTVEIKDIYQKQKGPKSLLELSRNHCRSYLSQIYSIKQPYQLCFVMSQIGIPEGIQDILLFEQKIYPN